MRIMTDIGRSVSFHLRDTVEELLRRDEDGNLTPRLFSSANLVHIKLIDYAYAELSYAVFRHTV